MKHQSTSQTKESRKLKNDKRKTRAFSKYIFKLLKESSHSNVTVSVPKRDAMDVLERVGSEAARLSKFNKRCAITQREVALALRGQLRAGKEKLKTLCVARGERLRNVICHAPSEEFCRDL